MTIEDLIKMKIEETQKEIDRLKKLLTSYHKKTRKTI
jgi:hypothetical protein